MCPAPDVPAILADVIDPYPHLSTDAARAAWAKHSTPLAEVRNAVDYVKFAKAMDKLTPEQRKQTIAAMDASEAGTSPYAWMRNISPERWKGVQATIAAIGQPETPEYKTASAANRILAAAAAARGETFDPATADKGPPQKRVTATAEQIVAAGRKARGEI